MEPPVIAFFVIIMTIALTFAIYVEIKRKHLLSRYWLRACTGKAWKKRFPEIPNKDIRAFLDIFVNAFLFSCKKKLKFQPDDKIIDIYNALYPMQGLADALELETFAKNLKKNYGVDLYKVTNNDITLGELFEMTRKESQ